MRRRFNTQLNWEYFFFFLSVVAVIVLAIVIIIFSFVYGYEKYTIFNEKLDASRLINKRYEVLFNMQINIDKKYILDKDMANRKKLYDIKEQETQREALLKIETKISEEICPIGTYVYLKEFSKAVKVNKLVGFQAYTLEDICFLTIDSDNYYTLSKHDYLLHKQFEERKK